MEQPSTRFETHLTIDHGDKTVLDYLAENTPLSRQGIKQAMLKGAAWFTRGKSTQRVRRAKKTLQSGDVLHLYYDEEVLARLPATPELVADQGAYSLWYKPYGMLSQGSKWGDHCTINRWAEQHLQPQRPAFVVHRLDRAATGLILIAHEKKVATALSALFASRAIDKCYRAVVHGEFPDETQTINFDIDGKTALSHMRRLAYDETLGKSLLEVKIETGRKHQIRRHLSEAGFPIVGDRLYGDVKKNGEHEDLQLTAFTLAFQCPVTGKPLAFRLPEDKLPRLSSLTRS
jgi:tRNA pseudouridine32 synthase/23S rRNA pseudouridine746 synthase